MKTLYRKEHINPNKFHQKFCFQFEKSLILWFILFSFSFFSVSSFSLIVFYINNLICFSIHLISFSYFILFLNVVVCMCFILILFQVIHFNNRTQFLLFFCQNSCFAFASWISNIHIYIYIDYIYIHTRMHLYAQHFVDSNFIFIR